MKIAHRRKQRVAGRAAVSGGGTIASANRHKRAGDAVGRMLGRLVHDAPADYLVGDMALDRSGGERVVICRTGIFVITTRAYTGAVRVADGILARGRHAPDRDSLDQVRRAAVRVREALRAEGMDLPWIQPVVCLPAASLERPQCCDGVLIARPWQLAYLMRHWRGHVLNQTEARRAHAILRIRGRTTAPERLAG